LRQQLLGAGHALRGVLGGGAGRGARRRSPPRVGEPAADVPVFDADPLAGRPGYYYQMLRNTAGAHARTVARRAEGSRGEHGDSTKHTFATLATQQA